MVDSGLQPRQLLRNPAYNHLSKPVLLSVGCLEKQPQPGNLLEMQMPESETQGVGLAMFEYV